MGWGTSTEGGAQCSSPRHAANGATAHSSAKCNPTASPPDLQLRWADVQRDKLQMALLPYDSVTVCIFCGWVILRFS